MIWTWVVGICLSWDKILSTLCCFNSLLFCANNSPGVTKTFPRQFLEKERLHWRILRKVTFQSYYLVGMKTKHLTFILHEQLAPKEIQLNKIYLCKTNFLPFLRSDLLTKRYFKKNILHLFHSINLLLEFGCCSWGLFIIHSALAALYHSFLCYTRFIYIFYVCRD